MAITSITKVLSELYTAPLNAAVDAEKRYVQIWKQILNTVPQEKRKEIKLSDFVRYMPKVSVNGTVDVAISMKIAHVSEKSGEFSLELTGGMFTTSGSFGFMNRSAEESMFKAATSVVLTNSNADLMDFLAKNGKDPEKVTLNEALELLDGKVQTNQQTGK